MLRVNSAKEPKLGPAPSLVRRGRDQATVCSIGAPLSTLAEVSLVGAGVPAVRRTAEFSAPGPKGRVSSKEEFPVRPA